MARRARILRAAFATGGAIQIHPPAETEVTMSTQTIKDDETQIPTAATLDLKLD